ncbi:MAG: OadG family protein [Holophagales bacterium]|jgi:Na+-transporting methylmalonyl-CoA/oxaloacetate decarboxylase gamma subunit|nr:OadG family protein [Holophagales bacterium]
MDTFEALFVTILGMGVVFFGLVLTIGFINVFNRAAKRVKWEGGHGHDAAPAPETKKAEAPVAVAEPKVAAKAPLVPPTQEVLAAISAAIEIELRLYQGIGSQRLTIRR